MSTPCILDLSNDTLQYICSFLRYIPRLRLRASHPTFKGLIDSSCQGAPSLHLFLDEHMEEARLREYDDGRLLLLAGEYQDLRGLKPSRVTVDCRRGLVSCPITLPLLQQLADSFPNIQTLFLKDLDVHVIFNSENHDSGWYEVRTALSKFACLRSLNLYPCRYTLVELAMIVSQLPTLTTLEVQIQHTDLMEGPRAPTTSFSSMRNITEFQLHYQYDSVNASTTLFRSLSCMHQLVRLNLGPFEIGQTRSFNELLAGMLLDFPALQEFGTLCAPTQLTWRSIRNMFGNRPHENLKILSISSRLDEWPSLDAFREMVHTLILVFPSLSHLYIKYERFTRDAIGVCQGLVGHPSLKNVSLSDDCWVEELQLALGDEMVVDEQLYD